MRSRAMHSRDQLSLGGSLCSEGALSECSTDVPLKWASKEPFLSLPLTHRMALGESLRLLGLSLLCLSNFQISSQRSLRIVICLTNHACSSKMAKIRAKKRTYITQDCAFWPEKMLLPFLTKDKDFLGRHRLLDQRCSWDSQTRF